MPEAGRLLGLSRNSAYAAAKAGLIPVLHVGGRMLVPKAALHQMLANAGADGRPRAKPRRNRVRSYLKTQGP